MKPTHQMLKDSVRMAQLRLTAAQTEAKIASARQSSAEADLIAAELMLAQYEEEHA